MASSSSASRRVATKRGTKRKTSVSDATIQARKKALSARNAEDTSYVPKVEHKWTKQDFELLRVDRLNSQVPLGSATIMCALLMMGRNKLQEEAHGWNTVNRNRRVDRSTFLTPEQIAALPVVDVPVRKRKRM